MTRRERMIAAVIAAVAASHLLAGGAYGDPAPAPPPTPELTHYVHLQSGSHVATNGGSKIDLPPGYFFDEPTFAAVNTAVKGLQDDRTRLTAENAALKKDLEGWTPGWYTLGAAIVGGIVLGYYVHDKL